ncbi:holo-ACP synthase AcpS [Arcanobacterium buesumense]|uniref:Holo-[acyl-carrier-protein] synthase n=1 Tax=Arcanobacterium buesumense TaxID=2722751 RepID=A0A6H2EM40_9ACTO|nr:holo-ACP synthase [Arcanobacterium buesumense]QJC22145.1 holo-ACP synthase [Arcanobacterium buesumense]
MDHQQIFRDLGAAALATAGRPLSGIGIDLVAISHFSGQLAQPGSSFRTIFTAREQRACLVAADPDASFAARWAAREAFIKAWSQALYGHQPAIADTVEVFSQIEVLLDAWHRPALVLSGEVKEAFECSLPPAQICISLSHDGNYAAAIAVICQQ